MRQKLLIFTMIVTTIAMISSCQKEISVDDIITEKNVLKTGFDLEEVKASSKIYVGMIKKIDLKIKESMPALRQTIENLKSARAYKHGNSNGTGNKSVIFVPKNYLTLQEAVDNSTPSGKIIVNGTTSDLGNVIVDVAGLTIEGEGANPTINGDRLIITAPGINIEDLTINMGVVISGSSKSSLSNNKITSMAHTPGFEASGFSIDIAVLFDQSVNCTLKENEIKGNDNGFNIHMGVLMYGGNGHTIKSNKVLFDPVLIPNTVFFEGIHASDGANRNKISDCYIKSSISFNTGINSFGIYMDGSDNEATNCIAENVSGSFVLFGDNNNINNCVARFFKWTGFEANGNNNKIRNCKADGNLIGRYNFSNFGLRGFASDYGENNSFENCEAKNNQVGIQIQLNLVNFPGAVISRGHNISNCNLFSNNAYGLFIYKSTLTTVKENYIKLNGIVGVNLVEVSSSSVINNVSKNNITCDFNQTNCTGNTVNFNQFGTSCTELPWVGPF